MLAGVVVMGDKLTWVNVLGLVIIIVGVLLYNWHKYQRVRSGELLPTAGGAAGPGGTGHSGGGAQFSPLSRRSAGGGNALELVIPMRSRAPADKGEQSEYQSLLPLQMEAVMGGR